MPTEADYNHRGLIKLMLRMPALRKRLQEVSTANPDMLSLCGAFDEASSTLDRLRKDGTRSDPAMVQEYESLCEQIEHEIIEICRR